MKKIKEFVLRHARIVLPFCFVFMLLFSLAVPAQAAEADEMVTLNGRWELYFIPKYDAEPPDVDYTVTFSGDFSLGGTVLSYADMNYSSTKRIFYFDNWTVKLGSTGASIKIGGVLDFMDSPATISQEGFAAFCTMFRQLPPTSEDLVNDVFPVFTGIGTWIVSSISGVIPMFYTEAEGLTFIGTLAAVSLGVAFVLLVIKLIRRFLRFR